MPSTSFLSILQLYLQSTVVMQERSPLSRPRVHVLARPLPPLMRMTVCWLHHCFDQRSFLNVLGQCSCLWKRPLLVLRKRQPKTSFAPTQLAFQDCQIRHHFRSPQMCHFEKLSSSRAFGLQEQCSRLIRARRERHILAKRGMLQLRKMTQVPCDRPSAEPSFNHTACIPYFHSVCYSTLAVATNSDIRVLFTNAVKLSRLTPFTPVRNVVHKKPFVPAKWSVISPLVVDRAM